jgi:hypothetical protein
MNTKTGRKTWITCLGVLAACGIAITAPPAYAQYKEILKTTTSKNGKSVDFPKTNAEITAAVVELLPEVSVPEPLIPGRDTSMSSRGR